MIPHGQALNITVVSYSGQFNVAFTGDHDALPSMQRLSVYTGEALEELEAALGVTWESKRVEPIVSSKATTEKRPVAAKKPAVRKPATAKVGASKPVKAAED